MVIVFAFLPVLCGTHHTFYNELRVDFIHAAAHLDRSSFVACRIWNRWSLVWRRRLTVLCRLAVCCLVDHDATLHTSASLTPVTFATAFSAERISQHSLAQCPDNSAWRIAAHSVQKSGLHFLNRDSRREHEEFLRSLLAFAWSTDHLLPPQ